MNKDSHSVSVIDSSTRKVLETFGIRERVATALAADVDGAWAASIDSRNLTRYRSGFASAVDLNDIGSSPGPGPTIAIAGDDPWATRYEESGFRLARIDLSAPTSPVESSTILEHEPAAPQRVRAMSGSRTRTALSRGSTL